METINEAHVTTRIYSDDSSKQIADKIYKGFIVGQSCTVDGWEKPGISKAEEVIKKLAVLDRLDNIKDAYNGKMMRRNVKPKNSVGGYVAHKIFRYDKVGESRLARYMIWRTQ